MGHRFDELPVVTTPSDSDKLAIEHDSLTSQITLARLIAAERDRLNQLETALQNIGGGAFYTTFSNASSLTSQVDAIANAGTYFGIIVGYGHQSETGLPINSNCHVKVSKVSSSTAFVEIWSTADAEGTHYIVTKTSDAWGSWTKIPTRSEITSINNSLTKSFLTVTPSADVTVVRCTACVVAKMLIMNGVITTTATKATGSTLFTISTVTIHNTTDFFAGSGTSGIIIPFYLATNGEVKCNASAPAGNYFFNLSAVVYG